MKILSKKKVDQILKIISENEIIFIESNIPSKYHDQMIENNAKMAYMVGGAIGVFKIISELKRYGGKLIK